MKCEKCKTREAKFKVFDNHSHNYLNICIFCEQDNYKLIEVLDVDININEEKESVNLDNFDTNLNDFDNNLNNKLSYGRLHIVGKTRKAFACRVCKDIIPIGSKCYNQAIKAEPFPVPTKICDKCGKELIEKGTEVAPKKDRNAKSYVE